MGDIISRLETRKDWVQWVIFSLARNDKTQRDISVITGMAESTVNSVLHGSRRNKIIEAEFMKLAKIPEQGRIILWNEE